MVSLSAHSFLPTMSTRGKGSLLFSTWTFSMLTRCTLLSTNDPVTLLPDYAGLTQNLATKPWWTQAESHHQPWARKPVRFSSLPLPFGQGICMSLLARERE